MRTSAVHPELLAGAFQCQDCRTMVEGVEQQFKYTEVWRLRAWMHRVHFDFFVAISFFPSIITTAPFLFGVRCTSKHTVLMLAANPLHKPSV